MTTPKYKAANLNGTNAEANGHRADVSDLNIINRIRAGDIQAFEEIVTKYRHRVYNLCRYMTGSARDAEDAAQDAFIKVYRSLEKFRDSGSFFSWLYRIAVNTCIDYRRKKVFESLFRSADGKEFTIETESNTPSPEESLESKQTGAAIERCLSFLSHKLRTVIVLNEIEGLSYEEIADVLNVSTGTVKSRISRAREELRRRLKKSLEQK